MSKASIEERADLSFIRYANVWEDADVLCEALKGRAKGGRVLSVASAGDNALALLILGPRELVAVDLNPAQLAALELRIAAFQALSHEGLLSFLGVYPDAGRLARYAQLRHRLSAPARNFWDRLPTAVEGGVIHAGKLERFLRFYQALLRALVHGPESTAALLRPKSPAEAVEFFRRHWDSPAWRLLNRALFSKTMMGWLGRDPEFFRHAPVDVTSGPRARLTAAMTRLKPHLNPYLSYHLTGNYSATALPKYLRLEHFKDIRSQLGRLTLLEGRAEEASGRFDAFNLSNIFEYMDEARHARTYRALLDKAKPGARLAYWNLHVERACPAALRGRVRPLTALSSRLHEKDQSWPYRSFHVDSVSGSKTKSF